ncbi:ABC transporter permease [Chitinophaga sp. GCM10012297]|uniref:ABC transporter permease n=1 Tax=Chitinophaga chungangae TaxID=2821488 RepID=A0ABS3YFW4_9BACT|nr:ABC transporter permease [Chitinophaga chungangae]MBO9153572.1 ABC transporter permease [Chitinophaga chungangae]
MLRNYLKIALRNLQNNKVYSTINIAGLAAGMAVALLIGLWIWDEVSFDKYHKTYDRAAQVTVHTTMGGQLFRGTTTSMPMGTALQNDFTADFEHVALASHTAAHVLAAGDKKISQTGMWAQESFPLIFSLKMLSGDAHALKDPSSVLLSRSVAQSLFGDAEAVNKIVRVDNRFDMKVAGVYEDLPRNTTHYVIKLLLPWDRYVNNTEDWIKNAQTQWDNHMCRVYVQLAKRADIEKVDAKIRNVPTPHITFAKEELRLHPMAKWHLHSGSINGQPAGGRIKTVRLVGTIGIFVLLLACINFMNLSTARSEKRSREVGIRKAIGSMRGQLMGQFLSESLVVTFISLLLALLLVQLSLPFFNGLTGKVISMPWLNPVFWAMVLSFTIFTGLVSGSYPALYLSGFEPVKVLKGTFRPGRFAAIPRKVLVVTQFTVSIALIIGTLIVYRQVQHARNRPVGYTREGLITIDMNTPDMVGHYDAIRNELLQTGAVADMAQSNSAPTEVWSNNLVDWQGKDPSLTVSPGTIAVSHDFGSTIGWTIKEGRDFMRGHTSDTGAFILNESAVKMTGFKEPLGKTMKLFGEDHMIIGVVKDMVMESPYEPIRPTIFHLQPYWARMIMVRIKPGVSIREGLNKIEPVFKKYNPGSPFVYKFTDDEYAAKFGNEERIASLTTFFSVLAIFISCLGLFGLASFVAEKRTKEIGIRKVMGASVFNLWRMLSKDFLALVLVSCAVAVPLTWYFLHLWLQQFNYRTQISGWIFVMTAIGAMLITLATVSYQAVKAAVMNPVKSLKAE